MATDREILGSLTAVLEALAPGLLGAAPHRVLEPV
jgi:hypothetical protein